MAEIGSQADAAGGSVTLAASMDEAFADADVIYAKSWGGKNFYGNPEADIVQRAQYRRKWIVDEAKMSRTNDALFMHCLPVRRNVIVSDEVIDSVQSVVIDEAENRLHIQKAILSKLLGK
jgi:N-acetylornithine carbamoyltransferase